MTVSPYPNRCIMAAKRSTQVLYELFASKTVVDLPSIRGALCDASEMTAFRYLRRMPYRRSYNLNGRYYCLHDASRYDSSGLWSWHGIHFSNDGSLRSTVRRLVHEAEAGATHRELQDRLHVRVQNTLLDLLNSGEVSRERLLQVFVYLHVDAEVRAQQVDCRNELIESGKLATVSDEAGISDALVIQVLLMLIRHPGSRPVDVVRYLRGYSPPIKLPQVQAVFTRFDLGEKKGTSTC